MLNETDIIWYGNRVGYWYTEINTNTINKTRTLTKYEHHLTMFIFSSGCIKPRRFLFVYLLLPFFQNNSNYMKCAINSVRYDATVFNNTVVCQNVIVSSCSLFYIIYICIFTIFASQRGNSMCWWACSAIYQLYHNVYAYSGR